MNKKLYILVWIIIGFLALSQASAIENWIQTIFVKNNKTHWWIWSTKKNNTNTIPSVTITEDSRLWVGLKREATITNTDNYYTEWDIIAQRFCIEWTRECTSSFKQDLSSRYIYNFYPKPFVWENWKKRELSIAWQDEQFSVPYTDTSKPIYIRITPEVLNEIWMDPDYGTGEFRGQQATKWVDIWVNVDLEAYSKFPKQLYFYWSDTVWAHYDKRENWHYRPQEWWALRSCYYTDANWVANRFSSNINFCSNPANNINRTLYCNLTKNHCWISGVEFRLVPSVTHGWNWPIDGNDCRNIDYAWIIRTHRTSRLDINFFTTTSYTNPPTSYEPAKCWYSNMVSAIQMRVVLLPIWSLPAQSLIEHAKNFKLSVKINEVWVQVLK